MRVLMIFYFNNLLSSSKMSRRDENRRCGCYKRPGVLRGVQVVQESPYCTADATIWVVHSSKIGHRDKNCCRGCFESPGGLQGGPGGSRGAYTAMCVRRFGSCNIMFSFRPLGAFGPSWPERKHNAARPKPSHTLNAIS